MSEIKKNIETCRGEDVLAEVSGLPQDPHFGSLVNEALDPLKQQAAAQEGWDGYSEVIEQHKPYTFASAIIQMKSNLLLLLRALWQFPFGAGTLRSLSDDASLRSLSDAASLRSLSDDSSPRSLSDMWQHYITRLSGNETYGIPSRLSSLTDLPSAPLLVADRDMSSGIRFGANLLPDGMSLAQLLCSTSAASSVTKIVDTNTGWTMTKSVSFKSYFPNSNKIQLGCGEIRVPFEYAGGVVFGSDEEYKFTALKKITPSTAGGYGHGIFNGDVQSHDIDLGDTEEIATGGFFGLIRCSGTTTDYRYALIARKLRKCSYLFSRYNNSQIGITKVVLGKIETNNFQPYYIYGSAVRTPNLIHWEFGQDTAVSLNLQHWNPSVALDASRTDLIEGSTAANNLEHFLSNFRTYIALRLATFASNGPTLTLSQAVYDAIKDESHLFVFDEGTMTIYAYLTNIKHWTVTK
jgi:hypothetical protein